MQRTDYSRATTEAGALKVRRLLWDEQKQKKWAKIQQIRCQQQNSELRQHLRSRPEHFWTGSRIPKRFIVIFKYKSALFRNWFKHSMCTEVGKQPSCTSYASSNSFDLTLRQLSWLQFCNFLTALSCSQHNSPWSKSAPPKGLSSLLPSHFLALFSTIRFSLRPSVSTSSCFVWFIVVFYLFSPLLSVLLLSNYPFQSSSEQKDSLFSSLNSLFQDQR